MSIKLTNQLGEIFTFKHGMINSIRIVVTAGIDEMQVPNSGPQSNQGTDVDGTGKTITISGQLMDSPNDSVTSVNNIRSMLIMKYWLEAIPTGLQLPIRIETPTGDLSALGAGSTIMMDPISGVNVTLNANFASTTAYLKSLEWEENEGDLEQIPFSMTLWVAGL